ncbi:MAG: hypothetical protein HXY20_08435 [Acidobacteria bacterium]|nr:hypothetical protein [Acidobacteriota bacterium]
MRRPTPIAVGLMVAVLIVCWQYLVIRFAYSGNWTALFYTGESTPLPEPLAKEDVYRFKGSSGYDGMYYHIIAHDPLLRRGFSRYVDNPRLRWRRILVPGLANLLAAGEDAGVDLAYLSVTIVFVLLGSWWLGRYCTLYGMHPCLGLAFLAVPAVLVSIERQTVDTAVAALTVGLVLHSAREPWKQSAFLVFLPLARETGLCMTAGAALVAWKRRDRQCLVLSLASVVPFLAWVLWVHTHTMRDGTPWFSFPFAGIISRTLNPVQYPLAGRWVTLAAILDYVAVIGIWVALALIVIMLLARPIKIVEASLAVLGLVFVCLGKSDIWGGAYEFGRTMSPMLVLLMMLWVPTRQHRYLIPTLLVLPRIALQYQPLVFSIISGIRREFF